MTSVTTLVRQQELRLPDLVDVIALRTGAWVVVERCGSVLAHGTGAGSCPPALADSLMREHGVAATAWFVGAAPAEGDLSLLGAAVMDDGRPVDDDVLEDLLHPRGPAAAGRAPAGVLVVLTRKPRQAW